MPPPPARPPSRCATFHWKVKPSEPLVSGRFYVDGSALDGPVAELTTTGWAVVVLNDDGEVIASAFGLPPPWVTDIGGAEGWALLQAVGMAMPGPNIFLSDCKTAVDTLVSGSKKATSSKCTHARVYALLFAALDDTPVESIVWMPAHQADGMAGKLARSDGKWLTADDIRGNREADVLAKRAVEEHRVPKLTRNQWTASIAETKARAKWIARATYLANNLEAYPFSDSEASRRAADLAQAKRTREGKKPKRLKPAAIARPVALGGHVLVEAAWGATSGWRCSLCRLRSANWNKIAPSSCSGSAARRWADSATRMAEAGATNGRGHRRVLSGEVVWCQICGSYADARAKGLADVCKGPPKASSNGNGGMRGQLKALQKGRHPRTRAILPAPVDEFGCSLAQSHCYANLPCHRNSAQVLVVDASVARNAERQATARTPQDELAFSSRHAVPADGKSAKQKMQERLERIRAKERAGAQARRRLRGKQPPPS